MTHACQEVSRLASDSLDRPLSLLEKLRFRIHLSVCRNCRNYTENMHLIHKATEMMQQTNYGHIRLSREQHQRLHDILHRETGT